jgi:hypothetical protein
MERGWVCSKACWEGEARSNDGPFVKDFYSFAKEKGACKDALTWMRKHKDLSIEDVLTCAIVWYSEDVLASWVMWLTAQIYRRHMYVDTQHDEILKVLRDFDSRR